MGLTMGLIMGWWFGTWMDYDFPETVGNVIILTDELIFFRGVQTTNQKWMLG